MNHDDTQKPININILNKTTSHSSTDTKNETGIQILNQTEKKGNIK